MLTISGIRHAWPEKAGFFIRRDNGYPAYTFLHFFDCVTLLVDGKTVETRPHACILYAPGTPQWFESRTPLLHDWFHFSGTLPDGILRTDTLYYPADPAAVTAAVREMEAEFAGDRGQRELLLTLKIEELFIGLARTAAGEQAPSIDARTEERFRRLRGEMFTHLGEDWPVQRMADAVHLSQSRFFSVYKFLYGKSPADDLICARIDAAKSALAFGNLPLSAIAEELGYRNLSHFMRQFRALTAVTPTAYRRGRK